MKPILFLYTSFVVLTYPQADVWGQPDKVMAGKNKPLTKAIVHSTVDTPAPSKRITVDGIVPTLELPMVDSGTWRAADNWAKRSMLMLYISPEAVQQQKALIPMIAFLLSTQQEQLKTKGIEPILIVPPAYTLPDFLPELPSEALQAIHTVKLARSTKAIQESLGTSTAPLTAIIVDTAGFVREIEPLPLYAQTRERLLDVLQNLREVIPTLQPGTMAPDFAVQCASWAQPEGRTLRLSDFRGRKNVLLTFFPRCFTGTCTFQLSSLRDQASALAANEIQVIAVSVDPAAGEKGQAAFARKNEFTFPFVPDVGRNLCLLYGAAQSRDQMALRISVLIDKNGIIRWIDKQIEPRTHGADVLERWKKENAAAITESKTSIPLVH